MTKEEIVIILLECLPFHQYVVYVDSGYGCLELAETLHSFGFLFTICCAKNIPSFIFNELHKNLNYGETASRSNFDGISALSFYSNKIVNMFTNQFLPNKFTEENDITDYNAQKKINKKINKACCTKANICY